MAANNFKVFNESKTNVMNDTDYGIHIQRKDGVSSGLAVSSLHNKLYRQTSIAAKAVADFIASQELDATDNDSILFSTNLLKALEKVTKVPLDGHNVDLTAHKDIRQMFNSCLRYQGVTTTNGEDTLWGQIGIKSYDNCLPEGVSGTWKYGAVVSLPSAGGPRLDIWYNHHTSNNGDGLWYRSGFGADKHSWAVLLDSVNYTKYAPTKTGTGASGTWGINITGTATKATNDGNGANISDTYLKKAGDTVTGVLNVPTQTTTDNSTKVANTAFVQSAVDNKVSQLVNSAPATLDTLKELSNALGDDPNFATTVANMIGQKIGKTDIQVITGEVANGGTIPLPDGFLESECKWFAGIKHSNVNEWRIDIAEGYRSNLLAPICTVSGRVVTVGTQVAGLDGGSYTQGGAINFGSGWARAFMPGTAWYICRGIHR